MGAAQAGNRPCPRGYACFRKRLRTVRANPPEGVTELSFSSPPSAYSVGFQAPVNAKQTERASLPSGIPAGHSGRGQGADILPPTAVSRRGWAACRPKGGAPCSEPSQPPASACIWSMRREAVPGRKWKLMLGEGSPKTRFVSSKSALKFTSPFLAQNFSQLPCLLVTQQLSMDKLLRFLKEETRR